VCSGGLVGLVQKISASLRINKGLGVPCFLGKANSKSIVDSDVIFRALVSC